MLLRPSIKCTKDRECSECFEDVPTFFNCDNGHAICKSCHPLVDQCPTCKIPYECPHSRKAKSWFGKYVNSCPNSKLGCDVKAADKAMEDHVKQCAFTPLPVNACEMVGFPCDFLEKPINLIAAVTHLKNQHNIKIIQNRNNIRLSHEDFDINRKLTGELKWTPVILQLGKLNHYILCFSSANRQDNCFTLQCVSLGNDPGCELVAIDCFIQSSKIDPYHWKISPVQKIVQCTRYQLKLPAFKIPLDFISRYAHDNKLQVEIIAKQEKVSFETLAQETISVSPIPMLDAIINEVECGHCKKSPIALVTFKCLQCPNFDLCQTCFDEKVHSNHVFALVKNVKQQNVIAKLAKSRSKGILSGRVSSSGAAARLTSTAFVSESSCAGCGVEHIANLRYMCLACPKIDLCQGCVEKGFHPQHVFGVIYNATQEAFMDSRQTSEEKGSGLVQWSEPIDNNNNKI